MTSRRASSSAAEEPTSSAPPPSETVPAGDPVDVAASATATAPTTAPPNEDAFGNRTTYVAANMLDGRARHLLADGRRRHRRAS